MLPGVNGRFIHNHKTRYDIYGYKGLSRFGSQGSAHLLNPDPHIISTELTLSLEISMSGIVYL